VSVPTTLAQDGLVGVVIEYSFSFFFANAVDQGMMLSLGLFGWAITSRRLFLSRYVPPDPPNLA